LATESQTGFVKHFRGGISAPVDGFAFLNNHPALWRYGVWPVLVNIVVTFVVWLSAFYVGWMVWDSYQTALPIAWWTGIVKWTGLICIVLLTLALGFATYLLMLGVICAWFFSKLAYHVELALGSKPEDLVEIPVFAQVIDTLRAICKLVVINVLVLFLHLIPVVGSIAAVVIGLYMDAYILGAEFLGYPLELRGQRWRDRQAFAKQWVGATVGLGIVVTGLMLIPIVGAVFQTTAVVGAVLLHRKLTGLPFTLDTDDAQENGDATVRDNEASN
jgi:CysZ protein